MAAALALYKGPPSGRDLVHTVTHYGTCLATWCPWSHGELVLAGRCYSSSARDKGVRSKVIDLGTGRWDVLALPLSSAEILAARAWFEEHDGAPYDWRNIVRFVAPPVGHSKRGRVCFEAIGEALGLAAAHKLTGRDLHDWAVRRQLQAARVEFVGAA